MSRTQRLDDRKDQNLLTAEFTTGQLIVVICVSLFVAMACFGLGILVGQFDPSLERGTVSAAEETEPLKDSLEMETYTAPALAQETREGRRGMLTAVARRTPETPSPRNPYMDNTPRLTALPPLTPQRSLPVQAEAPTRIPKVEAPDSMPAATPATSPSEKPLPMLTPIEPDEPLIETALAAAQSSPAQPSPQPATARPTTQPPATSAGGKFGVQLAAFSGSDRRARAESFQQRIRSELKVNAEIIPSNDDVHYRVIVGAFSDKESAAKACEDLRRKPGLNEAFVRPL